MKALICYFSGTGNTMKVAMRYREILLQNEIIVDLVKMEHDTRPEEIDLNTYDIIGFGYPVHAFNAPKIVIDFVKKLNKVACKKSYFIFKTSGEPLKLNNISSLKMKKILSKKNLILTNEYHYCMPYNIIFRHSDFMAYKMWQYALNLIPIDCKEILENKRVKLKGVFLGGVLAWIFRIEFIAGRIDSRYYKVDDKCVKCMRCVKTCPCNNISVKDGKIVFGKNCIICMRCSFFCPTNAIHIGFLEKWKVNGAYNFAKPTSEREEKHKKYCKKAYIKYFKRCDDKLLANNIHLKI